MIPRSMIARTPSNSRLLTDCDGRANASGCVERGNPRAAGAKPFCKGALRHELDFQLPGQILLGKAVLTDIAGEHPPNLSMLEKQAEALAIYAEVVADNRKVLDPCIAEGRDEIRRDATEPKVPTCNGHAVRRRIGDRGRSGRPNL